MKKNFSKFLAAVLAVIMVFTVVPMNVFAVNQPEIYLTAEAEEIFYNPDALENYGRISLFERSASVFDGSFGNQLSGETKLFYDAIVKNYAVDKNTGKFVYVLSEPLVFDAKFNKVTGKAEENEDGNMALAKAYLSSMVFDSADAFIRDEPDVFWLRNSSLNYSYSVSPDYDQYVDESLTVIDAELTVSKVTYTPVEIYENASADIAKYNNAFNGVVAELETYFAAQGPELTREGKLKYIHDYICNNSDYDYAGVSEDGNGIIRSVVPFFFGNKLHVCEGYAKTLKVLCDAFNIPCVLISGAARDEDEPENEEKEEPHMWNYVQMEDGKWYLIDVTWDDQTSKIYDTYFLADWNREGFHFDTIQAERYEKYTFSKYSDGTTGKAFVYPQLSSEAYVSHAHSWGEAEVVTEETCLTTGLKHYNCETALCDGFKAETIPVNADKHTFAVTGVTAATCTAQGYTSYACACGATKDADYTEMLKHTGGIANCVDKAVCASCSQPYGDVDTSNHKNIVVDKAVGATCTSTGLTEGSHCDACNTTIVAQTVIKKLDHTYSSKITTEATHLKEGVETFTCTCGDSYTKPIAKLPGHTYVDTVTAPTCTAQGYTTHTCECGHSYVDTYVAKLPHTYTGEITTQPTHITEGVKTFTCKCGDTYTEPVAKLTQHSYTPAVTEPTCTAKGYTTYTCICGDYYISNYTDIIPHSYTSKVETPATHLTEGVEVFTCKCGDTYKGKIEKTKEHTYVGVVTEPTCTTKGFTTYTCACNDVYVGDEVAKLPHTYTGVITTEPTHTTKGVKTFTCKCGDAYTEDVDMLTEHNYNYLVVVTDPTCTKQGYTTRTCICGDSIVTDYVPNLGTHTYTGAITTEPTHLTEGVKTFTCDCGDTYTEPVAKLEDHTYSEEITILPTHTTVGEKKFTCECGHTFVTEIAKNPAHKYTSQITKEATHLEEGVITYTCECGDTYTDAILKIPEHNYQYSVVVTDPTCTLGGYTTYTCECGDSYVGNKVAAKGHSYGDWYVTVEATCKTEGEMKRACSDCKILDVKTVEILPHVYSKTVTQPTCQQEGYTTYLCKCGDKIIDEYKPKAEHIYNDSTCEVCGYDKVDDCMCNCHQTGIASFIWKILRFFYKLLKINGTCECGVAHY